MTITELQNQIQQKALELPPDLLQEVFDYMEFIVKKNGRDYFRLIRNFKNGGRTWIIFLMIL